jgi:hypothetical protein
MFAEGKENHSNISNNAEVRCQTHSAYHSITTRCSSFLNTPVCAGVGSLLSERIFLCEREWFFTVQAGSSCGLGIKAFCDSVVHDIDGENGIMEVTNISNQDIASDIFIYYKNSAVDLFYGGITYRVRIEGGLAAGESARIISAHYLPKSCRIVGIMWDVR